MRFTFSDVRRPARVSKLVRAEFAARGIPLGLTKAQDVCARLYGYPTYHELKACIGRGSPSDWDGDCPPDVAAGRARFQAASLVGDGLPEAAAESFVERTRPTGASNRPGPVRGHVDEPTARLSRPAGASVSGDGLPTPSGAVEDLLDQALASRASDMHIESRNGGHRVYLRILGERVLARECSAAEHSALCGDLKTLSRMDADSRCGQDGGFQVEYGGGYVDFRVATVPSTGGEDVLLKVLGRDARPDLDGLGIRDVGTWRKALGRRGGLCLICGDTDSGKTAVLNASVGEVDVRGRRVVRDGYGSTGLDAYPSWQGRIGSRLSVGDAMRLDPDVLVMGELRDADTAAVARDMVLNGRSVIATASSGNILSTLNYLRDLSLSRRDISRVLAGVLVVDRLRTACGNCSASGEVAGVRCATCSGTGHSGYVLVSECVAFERSEQVSDALELIEHRGFPRLPWEGMVDELVGRVAAGQVSFEEARYGFGSGFEDLWASRGMGNPPVAGRAR